ncbi:MAG: hypothetical protein KIT45_06575 [Fimbriimonadia bacterium]|nr:hypothetical protein [Fimbriimonadia bacterium]
MKYRWFWGIVLIIVMVARVQAQINVPSDGSDGALNVNSSTMINLGNATTAAWNTPGNGNGVYDPNKWAVVFKYSSVNINGNLRFLNHPSGAPVVWLVQGDVMITTGNNLYLLETAPDVLDSFSFVKPGPGGFRGGRPRTNIVSPGGSAGLGPGGGAYPSELGGNAGYAAQGIGTGGGTAYGNPQIVPLIGGSGGAGSNSNPGVIGGAGGGAILIVASGRIVVNGTINADAQGYSSSWGGGGSGGSVRLIADRLEGTGIISANGGFNRSFGNYGSLGRIRIEVNHATYTGSVSGSLATAPPGNPPLIWPPANAPSVQITQIAEQNVPTDPSARYDQPDMTAATSGQTTVRINAQNVPGNWTVQLRIVRFAGNDFTINATRISGDDTSSVWEASLVLPPGMLTLQVRAFAP